MYIYIYIYGKIIKTMCTNEYTFLRKYFYKRCDKETIIIMPLFIIKSNNKYNENNLENIETEVRDDDISILQIEYIALHSKHTVPFCSICH